MKLLLNFPTHSDLKGYNVNVFHSLFEDVDCIVLKCVVLKVQSQQTQELHQQNQDNPVIHEQTIIKVVNGVGGYQETVTTTSSTPVSSPKPTRKSIAPRFVSPLNGKIVDQGADVILDAIVDGKYKYQLSDISNNIYSCVNKEKLQYQKGNQM